jgi:NAD(P)H-dependent nitrite reductase small subunit
MSEFVTVAKVGEIPEGRGRAFAIEDREVAVFLVAGKYYALDDYCPHMGLSLAAGTVHEETVICSGHMWAFRLSDGGCLDSPSLQAASFEVRVRGDQIQVRLPE